MPIIERRTDLPQSQAVLYILFSLTFLVLPFYYQDNLGGEGMSLPFNSVVWIGVLSLTGAGLLLMVRSGIWLKSRYLGLLLMFPVGIITSGFLSGMARPGEWLIRLGVILGGMLFWFALLQYRLKRRDFENLLYLLLASLLLHAMVGLLQIAPEPIFRGWIPAAPDTKFLGMFQQPNLQASLMATAAILSLYLASIGSFKGQRWPMKVLVVLTLGLSVMQVVGSGSRAGLLGLTAGLVLIFSARYAQWRSSVKWTGILLSVALLGTYSGTRIGEGSLQAYSKVEQMAEAGADIRPHIYRISLDVFKQSPLIGHGIGSFQSTFQNQRIEYEAANGPTPVAPSPRFSHPHNELLLWINEGGLLALLAIAAAASAVVLQLIKLGWQRGGAVAALLVPITLHTQVELPFYISTLHWLVLLVLLAHCFYQGSKKRRVVLSRGASRLVTGSVFMVVPLVSVFLVHSLLAQTSIMQYLKGRGLQPAHLNYALNNLYFRETGEYFTMRALMYSDLQQGKTDNLELFVEWAEPFLQQIPDIQIFQDLAIAYQQLGNSERALAIIDRAHAIYPAQAQVASVRERLLRGEILVSGSASPQQDYE